MKSKTYEILEYKISLKILESQIKSIYEEERKTDFLTRKKMNEIITLYREMNFNFNELFMTLDKRGL